MRSVEGGIEDLIDKFIEYDEGDLQEWKLYEPILAGLKVYNRIGIFFTVCLIWRRIFMLFVAMFLADHAWLQVLIFLFSSLFMCCFIAQVWPFIKVGANRVELFNEVMIMTVGILAMANVGIIRGPLEGWEVGEIMSWVIRFQIGTNICMLVRQVLSNLKRNASMWYGRHQTSKKRRQQVKLAESVKDSAALKFRETMGPTLAERLNL